MTSIKVAVLFFLLVNCVRAEQVNGTNNMKLTPPNSSVGAAPQVPHVDALAALFQAFGLTTRSMDMAIFQQLLTPFLGILSTGKFMPFVVPMIVNWLILPLMNIVKTAAKGLLLLGVTGWLVSAMVPALLAYMGLTTALPFVARSLDSSSLPFSQYLSSMSPNTLAETGLRFLNMNNDNCRMQLSCRAGEFLNDSYPGFTNVLRTSGVFDYVETHARQNMDPLAGTAFDVLQGKTNCTQLPECQELSTIEFFLDPERIANATRNANPAFSFPTSTPAPTTTSTTTQFPTSNDLVVSAIRRLASNYYSYVS